MIDEVTRTRTFDPAIAAMLLDALEAHPYPPRIRHHADPPVRPVPLS
ncbi:hypothetical protein [Streptosporangium nondiastaticum]|nr:hypothetical protein [Streptosporangium nondiastaticum]